MNFEIKDDLQLKEVLKLKDELIYVYDELRFSSMHTSYKAFDMVRGRLKKINDSIKKYIKESNCIEVICLEDLIIEPQEIVEIKTNLLSRHVDDFDIFFDGSIPSQGFLSLFYKDKKWGTSIYAKNNIPRRVLEEYHSSFKYNDPLLTRIIEPGVYNIEEDTTIGIAIPKVLTKVK